MSLQALRDALPPYARDMSANLAFVAEDGTLSEPQRWGAIIAAAYAVGVGRVIRELEDGCPLPEEAREAAKSAAALMAMNNVYYRATHLIQNREYATIPSRLHMGAIMNPRAPKIDFELWCVTVSAINGCGLCLDSHEAELRKRGVPSQAVAAAIRVGAVVNAVSRVIAAEEAAKG